ncbi:MAG: hypothetical protein NZ846_06815 [Thermus sp.]|uniref:hypothetical protein n=1 Tax=Thermus sp. TaxID=275 RepID=UPI0026003EAE|nr:hypothetical protein [Thermus sp.]MCS6868263.1 hypothetical protein [Thermus sp.]MCS7218674.1 hypothetical protein [Thermus sp.]MCX7848580.1 hypothetical protein [Thermus sp.]MDW8017863.1 hypothetical protein [Thermus sp.]MDW8358170.1 hypothetical protein [Thermus sp.]
MVYLLDLSGVYCEPVEPRLLRLLSQASGEPLFYLSQAFYDLLPRLRGEGPGALEALFPGASRLYPKAFRPRERAFPEPFYLVSDLPFPEGMTGFFHPEKLKALPLALAALGLSPEEALYLDDNPLLVERARALGYRAELFL